MKKYLYFSLLFLLGACEKEDIIQYNQEKESIQFNIEPEEMEYSINFAEQSIYENYEYYYFGDSLKSVTLDLLVSLMGRPGETDRSFRLKTVPLTGQDPANLARVIFDSVYTIPANKLTDTIRITLPRPEKRGEYAVGVTFDVDNENSLFAAGVAEQSIYRLNIADRYRQPEDWETRSEYTGEFSEEKYAFMVTILHKVWGFWNDWGNDNETLREALEGFNAAHPDNPKDFSFPAYIKPTWWEDIYVYVGDYSDEKWDFIKTIVPEYDLNSWASWPSYNAILREELAAYNLANPDTPLNFTFPEVQIPEPDPKK